MTPARTLFKEAAECRQLAKMCRYTRATELLDRIADEFDRLGDEQVRQRGPIGDSDHRHER